MKQFNKGFTLTEFLIVIAIIGILSVIVFPYYHSARKQLAFQRTANQLAQNIRRVQGMALGAEEIGGSVPEGGYGIFLKKVPMTTPQKSYILFTDKVQGSDPPNQKYDPGNETIEEIFFEEGIKIKELDNPHVNIIFKPPDPEVYLTDNDGDDLGSSQTIIKICLISDETKIKTIKVNKAGLISVE